MSKRLDTSPQVVPYATVTDLLSGAVLSSLIGAVIPQPQVTAKSVTIVDKTSGGVSFKLYKGASGGSVAGTEIFSGSTPSASFSAGWPRSAQTTVLPLDVVLESGETLTISVPGSGSSPLTVTVSAEITF